MIPSEQKADLNTASPTPLLLQCQVGQHFFFFLGLNQLALTLALAHGPASPLLCHSQPASALLPAP